MDVVSRCPLPVGSVIWQPRAGAFVLTVICKATFRLMPIESWLAEDQDELNETDRYWAGDERSSLGGATDNVPFKRRADVTLVGGAYSPAMQPVSSLIARLTVGELSKAIEVHGDRVWTVDGRLREGTPFISMPLWWERAAGGPDTLNPVGMRANAPANERGFRAIPNLQPLGTRLTSPSDVIPAIGFGPIAPTWPERTAKLHRHLSSWDHRSWNQRPLPDEIEAAFFNAAPSDQQVERLQGTERIVLENLLRDHPRFVTKLGHVAPRARLQRAGGREEELRLRCDTLAIDTDRGICALVWRGAVPLRHQDEAGIVVVTAEGEAMKRRGDDAAATVVVKFTGTPNVSTKPALPFVEGQLHIAPTPEGDERGRSGYALPARAADDTATITAPMSATITVGDPLPFLKPTSAALEGRLPPPELPNKIASPTVNPRPIPSSSNAVDVTKSDGSSPAMPEPPPMIGPLARRSPTTPAEPTPAFASEPSPPELVPEAPPSETEAPLDLSAFPIERFATIGAEIAEKRTPRAEILRAYELTERAWSSLERYFADALIKESARGSQKLQGASDHAYVTAVEGFRGPILIDEYARIVVAMERRHVKEVLDELKIQHPALMPILRLWTKKIAADAKLARAMIELLSQVRAA